MKLDKPEDKTELYRRLPEIKNIENPELQKQVTEIFLKEAPRYIWNCPASSSGKYHPEDTISDHGLWIHIKRSFTAFERLASTEVEMGRINEVERDYGRAAILLHDLFKQGHEPRDKKHTKGDHDVIAANYLVSHTNLPAKVIRCVETHNGGWGEGSDPETVLQHVHHKADMIASGRNVYIKMEKPLPEELKEKVIFSENG